MIFLPGDTNVTLRSVGQTSSPDNGKDGQPYGQMSLCGSFAQYREGAAPCQLYPKRVRNRQECCRLLRQTVMLSQLRHDLEHLLSDFERIDLVGLPKIVTAGHHASREVELHVGAMANGVRMLMEEG